MLKSNSLQTTLNIRIGLVIMGAGIMISLMLLAVSAHVGLREFDKEIAAQTRHWARTFAPHLWNYDTDSIEAMGKLAMESSYIAGLTLYDQDNRIVLEKGAPRENADRQVMEQLYTDQDILVGHMALRFRTNAWGHQSLIMVFGACSLIILAFSASFIRISFVLKQHLVKPLDNLLKDMVSVTSGEFRTSELAGQKDEIQSLVDGFNRMAAALAFREKSRQEAESKLEKSRQEVQSLFRIAPTGIGVVKDRIFYQVNDRFCDITGFSREALLGQSARMIYPSDGDYDYVGQEKYRQIRDQGTGTVETRFQRKDGKILDILMSSTPLDATDLSAGVTFTALDITQRKKAEMDLRESEEKYRSIMASMDDAAYICSLDGNIEYMNPAMEKMVGRNAVGEKCYQSIFGLEERCPNCFLEQILKGERSRQEFQNPGDNKTYHILSSPLVHADHSLSMLSILRDITELRDMETMVQQAQKMEAIGTLAGGIAHDFNNILFPIIGHAQMVLEDLPPNDLNRASILEIHSSALRAKELVNQILTFSRQQKDELRLMKIQPILKEALKMLRATIPATIAIRQQIDTHCSPIKADPTQIHQIIINLTTNAYHAMEKNGGTLYIGLEETDQEAGTPGGPITAPAPGAYACLRVKDTGEGIPEEIREKIFDPFFTTKGVGKGTGMGLSVVHGIVRKLGGHIQVDSRAGQGAEFRVYLPVEKASLSDPPAVSLPKPPMGTERILLVDDEKSIIEMETQLLQRLGYQVTSRMSSSVALDVFRNRPGDFDLVISDLAMPEMGGDKLAKALLEIRPDIPVLLCTGFSDQLTPERIQSLGIRGVLFKPIVVRELAEKLREILDQQGRGLPLKRAGMS